MVRNNFDLHAALDSLKAPVESRLVELPADIWSWLEADAERHGRSLDDELHWIIREHCAARRQHIPLAERWPAGRR